MFLVFTLCVFLVFSKKLKETENIQEVKYASKVHLLTTFKEKKLL